MSRRNLLAGRAVAVSVSDSPDLAFLGFGEQHLRDATSEVARHLLIAGAHLLYGGDLRPGGFTEVLLELIARYRPEVLHEAHDYNENGESAGPAVTNYLPWPVHMSLTP